MLHFSVALLFHWLSLYGVFFLFFLLLLGIVGLPIPDETLIMIAGFLIRNGTLGVPSTFIAVLGGACCGITVSYGLGRWLEGSVLEKCSRWLKINPKKIAKAHQWVNEQGKWTLVFGYFIPGFRHLAGLVAGAGGLPYRQFALFSYIGALLWGTVFLSIGYFFGYELRPLLEKIHYFYYYAALIIVIVFFCYLYYKLRSKD